MAEFNSITEYYFNIPIITRCFFTISFILTFLCYFDIISPLNLFFNLDLILYYGHYWRFFTCFLFFGTPNIHFFFFFFYLLKYCQNLEENYFYKKKLKFISMLLIGMIVILTLSIIFHSSNKFFGQALSFMMIYLWSKDPNNANVHVAILGVLVFKAPYLPFVLLLFSLIMGNNTWEMDLYGIFAGHFYYFFEEIYPEIARLRGWRIKKIFVFNQLFERDNNDNVRILF